MWRGGGGSVANGSCLGALREALADVSCAELIIAFLVHSESLAREGQGRLLALLLNIARAGVDTAGLLVGDLLATTFIT